MPDMHSHPDHVSMILGQMVKKWETILPEGVRALEKFSRENKNVLILNSREKQQVLTELRLKRFKGAATGQRIDLSVYAKVFEPINEVASEQKGTLSSKEASNGVSRTP